MSNQSILFGAGGLVLGLLGGVAVGTSTSQSKISGAIDKTLAPLQAEAAAAAKSQQEALAALEEKLAALESAMAASAPDLDALKAGVTEDMGARLDALSASLSDELGKTAAAQADAMKAAMADMSDGMAKMSEMVAEQARAAVESVAPAAPGGGSIAPEEAPEAAAADVGMGDANALSVGRTAAFADGAVRVFISRIDPASGSARLSVNGGLVTLSSGDSTTVSIDSGDCTVTLTGVSASGATVESTCGAVAAPAEAAAAEPVEDVAPENGVKPGNAVSLADGAVRVFVSAVDASAASARIAVNGVATQTVAAGEAIDVTSGDKACTLTVTGVGQGMVGLEANCG